MTMNRHIHLRDLTHIECDHGDYKRENIAIARSALVKRDLRIDNHTGVIRDSNGELERYSRQSDHEPHESLEDAMRWSFQRYIRNGASRIERSLLP